LTISAAEGDADSRSVNYGKFRLKLLSPLVHYKNEMHPGADARHRCAPGPLLSHVTNLLAAYRRQKFTTAPWDETGQRCILGRDPDAASSFSSATPARISTDNQSLCEQYYYSHEFLAPLKNVSARRRIYRAIYRPTFNHESR
jgi:hypothetical protein